MKNNWVGDLGLFRFQVVFWAVTPYSGHSSVGTKRKPENLAWMADAWQTEKRNVHPENK
jgi:hypothetical protein